MSRETTCCVHRFGLTLAVRVTGDERVLMRSHLDDRQTALMTLASGQGGVWLASQALEVGYSRGQIGTRLRNGDWTGVLRGVLTWGETEVDSQVRAQAASLTLPGQAVISHSTAAFCHGFDTVGDRPVHVTVPDSTGFRRRDGLSVHVARLPMTDCTQRLGLRVTTAERTALDLACALEEPHALAAVDTALHKDRVTESGLAAQLRASGRRRGIACARQTFALGDGRSESPPESHTRWLFWACGLPVPEPQVKVVMPGGWPWFRVDLGYREVMLAIEYDSEERHAPGRARARDRGRNQGLVHLGWTLIYVTASELYGRPWDVVQRIARSLTSRGVTVGALDPGPAQLLSRLGPQASFR